MPAWANLAESLVSESRGSRFESGAGTTGRKLGYDPNFRPWESGPTGRAAGVEGPEVPGSSFGAPTMSTGSSTEEQPADNRPTKVRLLPGGPPALRSLGSSRGATNREAAAEGRTGKMPRQRHRAGGVPPQVSVLRSPPLAGGDEPRSGGRRPDGGKMPRQRHRAGGVPPQESVLRSPPLAGGDEPRSGGRRPDGGRCRVSGIARGVSPRKSPS